MTKKYRLYAACKYFFNIQLSNSRDEIFKKSEVFMPFPFTEEETEVYDGRKILWDTGLSWTPLAEGLEKTWHIFCKIYGGVKEES